MTITSSILVPSVSSIRLDDAAAADARVRELYLDEKEPLQPITVDVPTVCSMALVSAARARAVCVHARDLPDFDAGVFDRLEDVALACWHRHLVKTNSTDDLQRLAALGVTSREKLVAVIRMAMVFGILPSDTLDRLQGGTGYRELAGDLTQLIEILRTAPPALATRTLLTPEDVNEAVQIGVTMLAATGVKDFGSPASSDPVKDAQRAFTLLVRTYDQVRRAVKFFRWNEGDADAITPSMFAHASPSRKSDDREDPNAKPPAAPSTEPQKPATPVVAAPAPKSPATVTEPDKALPPGAFVEEGGPFTE